MFRSVARSCNKLAIGCKAAMQHVGNVPVCVKSFSTRQKSLMYLHNSAYGDIKSINSPIMPSLHSAGCLNSLHQGAIRPKQPYSTTDKLTFPTRHYTTLTNNDSGSHDNFFQSHFSANHSFAKYADTEFNGSTLNIASLPNAMLVRYFHYSVVDCGRNIESQKRPLNVRDRNLKEDKNSFSSDSKNSPMPPVNDSSKSENRQAKEEIRENVNLQGSQKDNSSHTASSSASKNSKPEGQASNPLNENVGATESATKDGGGVEGAPEKMGLFKRFHHTYKQYGKILVAVHCATSTVWAAVFYYAAMSGVDVEPALRWIGASEKIISFYTMPGVGNAAVAYLFYKIATPVRYPVTIGGTHLAVRYLRKWGYMPPIAQENTIRSLMSEGKTQAKDKYKQYQGQYKDFSTKYKERRKNAKKRKKQK